MSIAENLGSFEAIWAVDAEFYVKRGGYPHVICIVFRNLLSGVELRLAGEDLRRDMPDFLRDPRILIISYYAPAECGAFLSLGWRPLPQNIIDLYCEFKNQVNGMWLPSHSLLGALGYYRLPLPMDDAHKNRMRNRIIRGGPFTPEDLVAIVEYCAQDVLGLELLFRHMQRMLDVPRALIRGRYVRSLSEIECTGIPIDTLGLATLRKHWPKIQRRLIHKLDATTGFFDSWQNRFKYDRFESWINRRGIAWPRTASGRLALDRETVKIMSAIIPELTHFHELRTILSKLGLLDGLAVGPDGRNRTMLSPFSSITGRNQPSTQEFILSLPKWVRSLIIAQPGYLMAELDFEQEEFAIAAAISGDRNMMEAYQSDPYMTFAKQAGLAPQDATKESHPLIRQRCKQCMLGTLYGMGAETLGFRIQQPTIYAQALLDLHRRTYRDYWRWNDGVLNYALTTGSLRTVFGWQILVGADTKARTLRKFLVQANAAEILRLACIFAVENGVSVCAPHHDSLLIEAPAAEIENAIELAREAMVRASKIVLDGFGINVSVKRFKDRYRDPEHAEMWNMVWDIVADLNPELATIAEQCR